LGRPFAYINAMKIIDESHPFYKPLWRRLALVGVLAGWTAFEVFYTQQPLWIAVAGGLFAYTAWIFLISWRDNSAN
jgi:hypothetical protein